MVQLGLKPDTLTPREQQVRVKAIDTLNESLH